MLKAGQSSEGLSIPEGETRVRKAVYVAIVRTTNGVNEPLRRADIQMLAGIANPALLAKKSNPAPLAESADERPGIRRLLLSNNFTVWAVIGGGMEKGETELATLIREAFYETSLSIDPTRHKVEDLTRQWTKNHSQKPGEAEEQDITLKFVEYHSSMGEPTPGEEMEELRWVNIHDVRSIPIVEVKKAFYFVLKHFTEQLGKEFVPQVILNELGLAQDEHTLRELGLLESEQAA